MSGIRRTTILMAAGIVFGGLLLGAPAANAGGGHTIVVKPGQSIQAAVDKARSGDTIELRAGTYTGGVRVTTGRLTIEGVGARTVLVPGGTDNCAPDAAGTGICVTGDPAHPVSRVHIQDLTVRGFGSFGIEGFGTDRLRVNDVTAADNGEYGITEFASTRGAFVDNKILDNSLEAGLYVGDITDAQGTTVSGNYASGNALGVLVRHARHVKVTDNTLVGNCTGIALVDDGQPGGQGNTLVSDNRINRNNKVCPPHEEVPPLGGTGIVSVGGANNVITGNEINGNQGSQPFSGGVVLTFGVNGNPSVGNKVIDNEIHNNKPYDIVNQSGGANTIRDNDCRTSSPAGLCG